MWNPIQEEYLAFEHGRLETDEERNPLRASSELVVRSAPLGAPVWTQPILGLATATWSPDGTKILIRHTVVPMRSGRDRLHLVRVRAPEDERTVSGWFGAHTWTPDSRYIAVQAGEDRDEHSRLTPPLRASVIDVDTGKTIVSVLNAGSPAWLLGDTTE